MALTPEQIRVQQERILANMKAPRARGRAQAPERKGMNKTERAYAQHLLCRMLDGDVAWFEFEAVKFRLADRSWYAPDFIVMRSDGMLELHEVKGAMEDDAAVKLRLMPRLYSMFRLFIVRARKGGGWDLEERTL